MQNKFLETESPENIDDTRLVKMILQNQDFFTLLVGKYEDKIRRYLRRISGQNNQDLEDTLQDVFIKVYINLNEFDSSLSLNAWIYRMAHNLVIDRFRKDKRQKEHGKFDVDDDVFSLLSGDENFLLAVYKRENAEYVHLVMEKIKPSNKEILYLRFIENYSYRDIADILKKTESSVTSILHRAKKEFKQKYEELRE